jgi:hypothetical protein
VLVLVLLVVGFIGFFAIAWIDGFRNPHSKGKTNARLAKTYEVQVSSDKVVRPNQGSSRSSNSTGGGLLYLVSNEVLNSLKIGISRMDSQADRIQSHQEYGWKLEKCWNFDSHSNAQQVEGATIAWWRNHLKMGPSAANYEMPQGGYTETVSLDAISFLDVYEYVNKLCVSANGKEAISVPINDLIVGAVMQTSGFLDYVGKRTRTAKFEATHHVHYRSRWHEKTHHWQQWVISNGDSNLTIEVNEKNSTPIQSLKIGSRVDVVGRVESVKGELRMTNPAYTITTKRLVTRKNVQHTNQLSGSRKLLFFRSREKVQPKLELPNTQKRTRRSNSARKTTAFENKMNNSLEYLGSSNEMLFAERCSACGALVANGASHDCW